MPYRPSIRQLEYIVAVAECGHFGRAARRCNCSQPTLSVQIGLVEQNLDVRLFERSSAEVRLTPIGETFVHGARLTLAAMNDLMDAVDRDADTLGGVVKLGTSPSFGPYFLPAFLPYVHNDYPDLKIYVSEDRPASVERDVAEGTVDCGVGPACSDPILKFSAIGSERLYLGVPADHGLASETSVSVSQLGGERLLALGSGNRLFENVQELADISGAALVSDFEGTSLDAIRQMITVGMGCSLFPELYARAEFRDATDVRLLVIEDWPSVREVGMYWRDNSGREAHFVRLLDEARRAAVRLDIATTSPLR